MANLHDSLDLIRMVLPEAGTAAIEYEILGERARSLGASEARVVKALARLNAVEQRETGLAEARDAVWSYFVQRELIGFRSHADVIRHLGIPDDVLAGLGAVTPKAK